MTTFRQTGAIRIWANATGSNVVAGELVILRSGAAGECGIACSDIANGASGLVMTGGVHEVTAATGAIAAHGLVYRAASAGGPLTATASGATLAGTAIEAKTTAATTAKFLLNNRVAEDLDIAS